MQIWSSLIFVVLFGATAILADFTLIQSATLGFAATHREIRIYSGNAATWSYQACMADSGPGQLLGMDVVTDTLTTNNSLSDNTIPYYDVMMIQGLPDCSYIGMPTSQPTQPSSVDTPTQTSPAPGFAVWFENQILIYLNLGASIYDIVNVTMSGSFVYNVEADMDRITSWELYQDPKSKTYYMVVSQDGPDAWGLAVFKCNPDCVQQSVDTYNPAFATITANATHWFMCYKQAMTWSNRTIESGFYACKHSVETGTTYYFPNIETDNPITETKNDQLYSCMISDTKMILAVSNSATNKYTLYQLDTANGISADGRSTIEGNMTVMAMSCMDQVVLVTTQNSIDYWVWDDGSGFVFPPPSPPVTSPFTTPSDNVPSIEPSIQLPAPTPGSSSAPTIASPTSGVNQPNATVGLTDEEKVIVGVVVGVGVPLIGGAIVLVVMRKKLRKNNIMTQKNPTYSSINLPSKESQLFEKKLLIPFEQLSLIQEIGSGSFGKVFLGTWQGTQVAIKKNNQMTDTKSFLAEAKLTLSMPPHPNLVQTFGVCTDSDNSYIVLEYCEGGSLDKIVFNQTLNNTERRALVLGIAHGLAHLHRHNIVHRDLAVRNILLRKGKPKISDFGMSRVLKEEAMQGKTDNTIGPIRWMAPESVLDMSYSYKSDVWTFGIVVSEIVNGHEPHEGENQLDVAMQIREEGYTPSLPDECDPVLLELMQMCWRMNPDDRPAMNDIVEFLNDKFAIL